MDLEHLQSSFDCPRFAAEPPAYSSSIPSALSSRRTSRRGRVKHEFHLTGGKEKPWATLKVLSNARFSNQPPVFLEGDTISGSVEVDESKLGQFQAIDVSVSDCRHKFAVSFAPFIAIEHFTE
jgi:hypothetical protein